MKTGYDVIGDVHGQAGKLEGLLKQMGYQPDTEGTYRHPTRTAIFVGDLVDRGPDQLKTLQIVRSMVETNAALIVMGNHEFNALAFDAGLRPATEHNLKQHEQFLILEESVRQDFLAWFWTIPLWLEIDGLRVIHACWNQALIDAMVKLLPDARMTPEFLEVAARKPQGDTEAINPLDPFWAIEALLKGPEVPVTPGYQTGKEDKVRHQARFMWWVDDRGGDKRQYLATDGYLDENGQPGYEPDPGLLDERYRDLFYREAKPVIFGHYWRTGTPTYEKTYGDHAACVDFSAAKEGHLTAYRFTIGETSIHEENFVQYVG